MQSIQAFIRGVQHPEAFHGSGKTSNFFEGWYIKLVSSDTSQRWAVIPGIFRGPKNSNTDVAFVQILDGQTGRSWFHEFPIDEFSADTKTFEVKVGENVFNSKGVSLHLPQLQGELTYDSELDPWPVTITSPGIMGWYGLVPFMECFHGIVSFGHELVGSLHVEGQLTPFDGGRGYIEKDWGSAFPAGYVWMQSNHFANHPQASIVASSAIIPWLSSSFRGFIVGLKVGEKLFRWTTYNKTHENSFTIDDSHVRWSLSGPDGNLDIAAERKAGGLLHAPLRTSMFKRVEETMVSKLEVRLTDKAGRIIFEDVGDAASMEVFGDLERLLDQR